MIWLPGNHDSPGHRRDHALDPRRHRARHEDRDRHRRLRRPRPGRSTPTGSRSAAVPDPRVYGGPGEFGAEQGRVGRPPRAARGRRRRRGRTARSTRFDIFATHEPVAADELRQGPARPDPPDQHRTSARTEHGRGRSRTGPRSSSSKARPGAGGLDNLNRGVPRRRRSSSASSPSRRLPVHQGRALPDQRRWRRIPPERRTVDGLPQVTASTRYLKAQDVAEGRSCDTSAGITLPYDL